MKRALAGLLLLAAQPLYAAAAQDAVALADRYLAATRLTDLKDLATVQAIKTQLATAQGNPAELRKRSNLLVSQLTVELSHMPSVEGITAASATLLKADPDSPRATNLFGAVLHSTGRFQDAATVLEVTLSQAPDSMLVMLSLASVYLDAGRDADAKKMVDRCLKLEPDNRDAWKSIAVYWFRKGDLAKFHDALLRSSTFAGYVRGKQHDADKPVDANEEQPGDSLDALAAKVAQLKNSVPLLSADLVEDEFPKEAKQIRDRYGSLVDAERIRLPKFPQIKTNEARDYTENYPIVAEWVKVITQRQVEFLTNEKYKVHVTGTESEAEIQALGKRLANEQMTQQLQQAQDGMKFLENMQGVPGMNTSAARDAVRQVQKTAQQQGVKLDQKEVDPDVPPGYDSGSVFAKSNYRNYLVITHAYESYLRRWFEEYRVKEMDNLNVYQKKIAAEAQVHRSIQEGLDAHHDDRVHDDADPHDIPCYKERLRYKKVKNALAETYYKLWVNLYIPAWTQHVKPDLEDYWRVAGLYIRNMNDPKVVEREYLRVKDLLMTLAVRAATSSVYGGAFRYEGVTEEEEQLLADAIAAAQEQAETVEGPKFLQQFDKPKRDWVDWIGDYLVLEVSDPLFSFKITARNVEFNSFALGAFGGVKIDFVDSTLETYVGAGAKFDLGIKVAGVGGKINGSVETYRRTAHWDFENGTYRETSTDDVKTQVRAMVRGVTLLGQVEVDAKLNVKFRSKAPGLDRSLTLPARAGKPPSP